MRISDWSSDVCSSDLFWALTSVVRNSCVAGAVPSPVNTFKATFGLAAINALPTSSGSNPPGQSNLDLSLVRRSEERRVGKEGVSTCRSGWRPDPDKKNTYIHQTNRNQWEPKRQ